MEDNIDQFIKYARDHYLRIPRYDPIITAFFYLALAFVTIMYNWYKRGEE
jgi:hypothetical protein